MILCDAELSPTLPETSPPGTPRNQHPTHMVMTVVDAHFIIVLILLIIDDHSADQFPHGHLLQGGQGVIWEVQWQPPPLCPVLELPRALTSPLELMRAVRRLSPEPQLLWDFHTTLLGGLWVAPAPEAQI